MRGIWLIVIGVSACWLGCKNPAAKIKDQFKNKKIEGTFESSNDKLGTWKISPVKCLYGKERGFQGVWFGFGAGSPVEEIRVDNERKNDNVIEFRLADRSGTIYRVREKECKVITGDLKGTNVSLNDRHMLRLKGNIHFDCPSQKVKGTAEFDGCLPQTL